MWSEEVDDEVMRKMSASIRVERRSLNRGLRVRSSKTHEA
jgi:hypothetical protein